MSVDTSPLGIERHDSPISMRDMQNLSMDVDRSMQPLERDIRRFCAMLEWSARQLLQPGNLDSIVGDRLVQLRQCTRLPHTGDAVTETTTNFSRARALLLESRRCAEEAAALMETSMKHLAETVISDKRHVVERVVDTNAQQVDAPPFQAPGTATECYLCTAQLERPMAWFDECHCTQPSVACQACMLKHVYSSTGGGRKSEATCSFCRHRLHMSSVRVAR